ncbi:discoidin domain-containing protein [Virgibacillus pantothenticus]|uniref:discoidin domain-containing protein n=2 Tax=Virgibacillus pantothenticus TaxID=1473 RepID=UPI000955B44E|nr:discoidin domain-containing protein [Virgibacillus pantothenticus]MED3739008.1 discoidin domain-containing protein [Virgibacillus pantothenticus]QTY17007.1 FIVAR domain-containing protein [Virgibacillus pantothenticus]SIT11038.1 LPXTG-motif cell wall anchor domain-containing protein [Virgibacillus pantothenticus]
MRTKRFYFSIISILFLVLNMFSGIVVAAEENTPVTFKNAEDALNYIEAYKPKISSDGNSIILPEIPDKNYEVTLYGSDNKQIIDMNLNYYQPIMDMKVNILYKVANKNDRSDVAVSANDIPINVKGQYEKEEGDNSVPNVIPGLREWKGYQGEFTLLEDSKIVIDSANADALIGVATTIQGYIQEMVGKKLNIHKGSKAAKGDIYLTLNRAQEHLGKEGYTLNIKDNIEISAPEMKGIQYGGISLTQILYQSKNQNTIPKGYARDYPKYEVRSGMLDVGRMFIPLEKVQEMAEYMSWFKLNELQMHINDYWASADYHGFRVESKKYPEINAKDGYYPQDEYIAFQKEMKKHGIDVVTEIDTPYHAESFRAVNPDMMLKKGALDITTPEKRKLVYPFIESLMDEFLGESPNDKNRVVQSDKFHIGTDEYDKKYSEEMRAYTDHFIKYVNNKGYETRLWGSLGKNGFDGDTPVSSDATMNIWATHWSDVNEMYDMGFDIINTTGTDLYIVPIGNAGYPDYLDIKDKYDKWEVNKFRPKSSGGIGGATMPFAHPQTKGAEFALWNDVTSFSGGLSSFDIFDRLKDAVMLVSEKTWYGEKTEGQTSGEFMERVGAVENEIPMSNPARFIRSNSEIVAKYDFNSVENNVVKDLSGNDYNAKINGGTIVDNGNGKALQLDGNGYLELPFDSIGYPYSVSFDIKLDKDSLENATLFSGDEGNFYLDIDGTGKLGYERNEKTSEGSKYKFENYKFKHDYSLEENKWQNIIITGNNRETTLYIDGKKVSTSTQINKLEGRTGDSSTFVLPLEKIGNGIKGTIDNFIITNNKLENSLQENIAYQQKVTASSEYDSSQAASFITDGNFGTRWGSKYNYDTEEEKDNQWIMIELDEIYDLSTVKVFWEKARANKYDLQVSEDGKNFKTVYSYNDKTRSQIDTINLQDVKAKYVKIVMSERASKYGYSIFEVEIYGNLDLKTSGQKLVEQVEKLLGSILTDAGDQNARSELIAAKDELKSYLSEKNLDIITYDRLAGKVKEKLKKFKKTVDQPRNLAYKQKATASSQYNDSHKAANIIDGDYATRWGSQYKVGPEERDNQWIMVELDDEKQFDTVKMEWEQARASEYEIFVSKDEKDFEKVYSYSDHSPKGNRDIIHLKDTTAKYVKISLTKPTTKYGYSMFELEIYDYSKVNKLKREGQKLLKEIPKESVGKSEREELVNALKKWDSFVSARDKAAISYHQTLKLLNHTIGNFKASIVPVTSITLDKENIELKVNEEIQLHAKVEPQHAANKEVKWSSSNEKVATVNSDGVVTGITSGNATITAQTVSGGHKATSSVTVKEMVHKEELKSIIDDSLQREESNYTEASWKVFAQALEEAKNVLADEKATQDEVDKAAKALTKAIEQLEQKVDKSILEEVIVEAETKTESNYTEASWKVFAQALEEAKNVLADEKATQDEVDKAAEALTKAIEQLEQKVDKSILEEVIVEAETKTESNYTEASWKFFTQALEEAKNVLADEKATQDEVDDVFAALTKAMDQLTEKVDKSVLEEIIEEAEVKKEINYTEESWKTFVAALEEAKAVLDNEEATQELVAEAIASLTNAMESLEVKPGIVDKSKLEFAVKQADTKDKSKYTEDSWETFVQALDIAKKILDDEEVTQNAVDETFKALTKAMDQLEEKVDKSALEEVIEEAGTKRETNYTETSWKHFVQALEEAQNVLANEESTQNEVDKAFETLIRAMEQLEEKADKLALEKVVVEAEAKKEANYTEDSWKSFSLMLEEAKNILEDKGATQGEVDKAVKNLKEAIKGLKEKQDAVEVDKSDLKEVVNKASKKDESNYTEESWKVLVGALEQAHKILNNEEATQNEVDAAVKSLMNAIKGLEEVKVDKSALEKAISKAKKKNKSDYTANSWKVFTQALKEAQDVIADKEVTQEEVDQALNNLEKAISDLTQQTDHTGSEANNDPNTTDGTKGTEGTKNAKNPQSSQERSKLPNTATNIFSFILIGSLILAFGLLLFFLKRKSNQNE